MRITRAPRAGTCVTLRVSDGSGSGLSGMSSKCLSTTGMIAAISVVANEAPMQRRGPPPNGIQV